jgi:hypothetical protein
MIFGPILGFFEMSSKTGPIIYVLNFICMTLSVTAMKKKMVVLWFSLLVAWAVSGYLCYSLVAI